jgi:hypothetical protein
MGQDTKGMSDRDLLIVLNERMDRVMDRLERGSTTIRDMELKVIKLETRLNIYVAVATFISTLISSIISKFF